MVLLLVFALAFSWVSVLVGILAKDPEQVQIFGFTALFPITFVSNVFVPTDTMPGAELGRHLLRAGSDASTPVRRQDR